MKMRLDKAVAERGLAQSRTAAARLIEAGKIKVNGRVTAVPNKQVDSADEIKRLGGRQSYVSRGAEKLVPALDKFGIDVAGKCVLDVGSSTGGFTQVALKRGASKVIAVDVGTKQMHEDVKTDSRVELHEKTDIRKLTNVKPRPDLALIDVSFISARKVLPSVTKLIKASGLIVLLLKPQFEVGAGYKHKGVIKNNTMRRAVFRDFEAWAKQNFVTLDKADAALAGTKGNRERFYLLNPRK